MAKSNNDYDVLVVGSGIAGLFAAYKAADFARVCLLTKGKLNDTNTWLAQGGIAAALGEDDSPERHGEDTLAAGAGLCDADAVSLLVAEGPRYVRELQKLGTPFDYDPSCGRLALTREGAHHRDRVLHAGGDATGRLIQATLQKKLEGKSCVTLREDAFVTDLVVQEGTVCGVRTLTGEVYRAGSVILATGGLGQVYARTTNPPVATGDGIAMAYRAGAAIKDMEFIQFHPTVFAAGQERDSFLISEAVRGEGAVLRNTRGQRFLDSYHPMAELGPRDVVARAILDQMCRHKSPHVCLDITHRDRKYLQNRFPTIFSLAARHGYDLSRDWLPVVPAAHYSMGGICTGPKGQTSLTGLYACGEVACSGIHGANRLASNSLLEGLVFAARAVEEIKKDGKDRIGKVKVKDVQSRNPIPLWQERKVRKQLREAMFRDAGIIRDRGGLIKLDSLLKSYRPLLQGVPGNRGGWELQNIIITAGLIQTGALERTESRGAHFRSDFPLPDPAWARHLCYAKDRKEGILHASHAV